LQAERIEQAKGGREGGLPVRCHRR
jgi:hypothetical protein